MSLEKFITFVANCDECSNYEDTDEDDFMSAVEWLKRNSWKIVKDAFGNWAHKCPACAEDEKCNGGEFDDT